LVSSRGSRVWGFLLQRGSQGAWVRRRQRQPTSWPVGCSPMGPGRVMVVLDTISPSTPCSRATSAMSAESRAASRQGSWQGRAGKGRGQTLTEPARCDCGPQANTILAALQFGMTKPCQKQESNPAPVSCNHPSPPSHPPCMSSAVRSGAILTSSGGGPCAGHCMPSRVCFTLRTSACSSRLPCSERSPAGGSRCATDQRFSPAPGCPLCMPVLNK
jgi:hypothetical protein